MIENKTQSRVKDILCNKQRVIKTALFVQKLIYGGGGELTFKTIGNT